MRPKDKTAKNSHPNHFFLLFGAYETEICPDMCLKKEKKEKK